jgi:hypothetical protein
LLRERARTKPEDNQKEAVMHKRNVTRNLMVVTALVVVAIIAMFSVGCGGGGGKTTPTEPPRVGTPTPTPMPTVQPSISFVASTPDFGSTIPEGGSVSVKIYVVVNPGTYSATAYLYDADGKVVTLFEHNPEIYSTGYYYISLDNPSGTGLKTVTSTTMVLHLNQGYYDMNPPVTQSITGGWIWQH